MNADLEERAAARWRRLISERPDIEAPARLQQRLLEQIMTLGRELAERPPAWGAAPDGLAFRLSQGVPALRGATVPLPVDRLTPVFLELCATLEAGGAGAAARHVGEAVAGGRVDPGSLFSASLARQEDAVRTKAQHLMVAPDLFWLVAEMTVSPVAWILRARSFAIPDVARAVAGWTRGYCPACGSWPALAEVAGRSRTLCCSFCGADWSPPVAACIYCGEAGDAFAIGTPDPERPDRRLELCGTCGGYLKQIELRDLTPFPLAAIEDLASMDLDVDAMQRGFDRKTLPAIGLSLGRPGC